MFKKVIILVVVFMSAVFAQTKTIIVEPKSTKDVSGVKRIQSKCDTSIRWTIDGTDPKKSAFELFVYDEYINLPDVDVKFYNPSSKTCVIVVTN